MLTLTRVGCGKMVARQLLAVGEKTVVTKSGGGGDAGHLGRLAFSCLARN